MKTRIAAAQILYLQLLDRLNDIGGNQKYLLVNACQMLQRLDKQGGAGSHQIAGLARKQGAVRQLDGRCV